jgi:hypothetical protein
MQVLFLQNASVPYSCCVHDEDNEHVATNYTLCQNEAAEIFATNKSDVKYIYRVVSIYLSLPQDNYTLVTMRSWKHLIPVATVSDR